MNKTTYTFPLDFSSKDMAPVLQVSQDDAYSRELAIMLKSGGAAWNPPADVRVLVNYAKPDGTGGEYDTLPDGQCAWSLEGNLLTIALAPQVCTAAGMVQLAVILLDGEAQLSTFAVRILVHPRPWMAGESEVYYNPPRFLPQPDTAVVGQQLQITKVDPSGKILELKTVEAGTGGSGRDGVSPTFEFLAFEDRNEDGSVSATGTEVLVTDAEGRKSFYVYNGQKGEEGERGEKGEKGERGEKGEKGEKGENGSQGKSAYQSYRDLGGTLSEGQWLASLQGSGAPDYADSVEAMTDTSKAYLGSNGHLWAYGQTQQTLRYNAYDPDTATFNTRMNSSGANKADSGSPGMVLLDYEPITLVNPYPVKVSGVDLVVNSSVNYAWYACFYNASKTYIGSKLLQANIPSKDESGAYVIDLYKSDCVSAAYVRLLLVIKDKVSISAADVPNLVVEFTPKSTVETVSGWADTGITYANYSLTGGDADRIVDKMLARLDVSYVSSEKVLTVGQYTFRYDGPAIADIGVST